MLRVENTEFQIGEYFPKFKAAAVQAASVYMNREATTDKAIAYIEEAAKNGADIIAFPEVFIPGDPYWAQNIPYRQQGPLNITLFKNAVEIPSPTTDRLCEAAKKNHIFVVMGINERDNKTIYNTLIYIDKEGRIIGKHRKFMPTGAEKLVWGEGDGSTHKVIPTELGRLGSMICGEHIAVLPGYVLGSMAEQVHIASWVEPACAGPELVEICSRYHAMAYNCYVICAQGMIDDQVINFIGGDYGMNTKTTWAGIIEPGSGNVISNRLPLDQEGIVYADCDLEKCIPGYFFQEPTGFYMGKQFQLFFNDEETKPFNLISRKSTPEKDRTPAEYPEPYDPFSAEEDTEGDNADVSAS